MSEQQPSAKPRPVEEKYHDYPWWAPRFWQGMRLRSLYKLFWENGFAIRPSRLGLAFTSTSLATFNSVMCRGQSLVYGRKIRETQIVSPPIFIIGHWRSGTTY